VADFKKGRGGERVRSVGRRRITVGFLRNLAWLKLFMEMHAQRINSLEALVPAGSVVIWVRSMRREGRIKFICELRELE
jgi:hypothetical protein